ncbi:MAG TPA: hybrid sensor histidine kinase/response regulator [Roseiflexaceae bacterium]|jgi:signal transduction histidine kinase
MRAGESILIVDPSPATRSRLQRLLGDLGYTVRQADSFDAALAALERDAWSFVIAAWALGERSGLELVEAFQALAPESAVIIAGDGGQETALAALRGGAADYLPMPIDATELAAALERAAGIHAARSQGDARAHALATRLAQARASQASIAQRAGLAAQSRLAAMLAHEINNPLTPIIGMAEILLEELPPEHPSRTCATAISAAAWRIRNVVRSLSDFAQTDYPQHTLLDLGALIRDTLLLAEHHLREQAISIQVVLPDDPLFVMGDAARLKQALLALLDNARDAMPSGGKLSIGLRAANTGDEQLCPCVAPNEQAIITISDTGCGIAAQHLRSVFEPFYSTKQQRVGVGMGLAIANSILQEHAGAITVTSVDGQGSTFCIALPCKRPASGDG